MQAISAIGMFSALVYAVLLYHKKSKSYSDKILIVWMVVFVLHLIIPYMIALNNQFFIDVIWGFDEGLYTLHITFLYYYSLSLVNNEFKFKLIHLKYLLPTAIIYMVVEPIDANRELFNEITERYFFGDFEILHLTMVVGMNIIFCLYFCNKFFSVLSSYREKIRNNYSFSENIDLRWLKIFYKAACALTSVGILFLIGLLKGKLGLIWLNHIYFSIISVLAVTVGYWGYKQGVIFIYSDPKEKDSRKNVEEEESNVNIDNSGGSEEKTGVVKHQEETLLNLMKEEKLYLEPTLNIGTVANKLGMHVHQLSKLINNSFNQNFFEFVNAYRVEEYKILVADPKNKNFSILGLALDAGFNSKATFNRIFKNYTGQTPSEFRENFKY